MAALKKLGKFCRRIVLYPSAEHEGERKENMSKNNFMDALKDQTNFKYTENGGIARKTTKSDVLDMFATGGAMRNRSDADVITVFSNAYDEDPDLAMKCLFYLRDIRGGQGERRFFRVAFRWLCQAHPLSALKNFDNVSEFGRWDDLIYSVEGTQLEDQMMATIKKQFDLDLDSKTPSLLGKWLPSENASSLETKRVACKIRNAFKLSARNYRKSLSTLRERINIVERLMSSGQWDKIEFSKIPSRAGIIYRNAFARRDIIAKKYEEFAKDTTKVVNADALYPNDIAHRAFDYQMQNKALDDPSRVMLQKYWDNLKDYYDSREENGLAIVDVSGSMTGTPMEAAVSLGAYIADKAHGPFAHHFITFSSHPALVKFSGVDIVDKLNRCKDADWGGTTDLKAVFDLLLKTALSRHTSQSDLPTRLYIFSDMEFNQCVNFGTDGWGRGYNHIISSTDEANSDLENVKKEWARYGYRLPQVIFWNLDARNQTIPAIGEGFSYVSGFSPTFIETILSGKDGYDLMIAKLIDSGRYDSVRA